MRIVIRKINGDSWINYMINSSGVNQSRRGKSK